MLNKLLKRCMPWMDKGRWYHVSFDVEHAGDDDITFTNVRYDSLFSNHESVELMGTHVLYLYFKDQENVKCILESKLISNISIDPTMQAGATAIGYSPNDYLTVGYNNAGNHIQISYPPVGSHDMWLFVRRF